MKSKWFHLKETAVAMRKSGMSMTVIERKLGIPRSTLSGWFKAIPLTEEQRTRLMKNRHDGWAKARVRSIESKRATKALRMLDARKQAEQTLGQIDLESPAILDLAFAMLYFGEGAKKDRTSLGSSDPVILKFMLTVLKRNYGITAEMIRCDLHLRMDQDAVTTKQYWAEQLNLPEACFKYVAFDKRTEGKPTFDHYKGVCVITCSTIAIQRKLISLYTLFCDKIISLDTGA